MVSDYSRKNNKQRGRDDEHMCRGNSISSSWGGRFVEGEGEGEGEEITVQWTRQSLDLTTGTVEVSDNVTD